jgi:hypothetical protein
MAMTYNKFRQIGKPTLQYNIVNSRVEECRQIVVHRFTVSDVEDPDIWAAEPIHKWETSEQGQWVMSNAAETPVWHRNIDYATYSHEYAITAKLAGPRLTEWLLRYGSKTTTV